MWWWWEPVTRANQVIYHFTASIHFFDVEKVDSGNEQREIQRSWSLSGCVVCFHFR